MVTERDTVRKDGSIDWRIVRSIARKAFKAFVAPSSTETSIGAIYNV